MKQLTNTQFAQTVTLLLWCLFSSTVTPAQTTAFTYQGKLTDAGNPANGAYDLQFRLFDALVSGNQTGATLVREDVTVSNGLFTVTLDFGAAAFPGANRFLEIGVRPGVSTGAFTSLSPLQPITATPYAVQSLNAATATTATTATTASNFSGTLAGDVTGTQGATTVARLQGRTLANTAPLGGQVLKFNSTTNQWEPNTDNTAAGGGGTITGVTPGTGLSGGGASGNVTLNIANGGVSTAQLADNGVTDAKIVAVSGGKVAGAVANATNAVNAVNATTATSAVNFSGALAGDVTGNQGTTTVEKLRNLPLPAPVLADNGKVLRYKNDGVNPANFELAADANSGGTITGVTAGTGLSGGGASGNVALGLAPGGIGTTELANTAVTTAKLTDASVTSAKLADGSVTDAKITDVTGSKVTGTIPVASIPAGNSNYIQNSITQQATSNFNISGNGTLGGVLTASALNSSALRQELTAATPNVINGFLGTGSGGATPGNRVTAGVVGATIGGGGFNGTLMYPGGGGLPGENSNRVTDWFGTVGGGFKNRAGNDSGSPFDVEYATVAGGTGNTASGYAATIGGGNNNIASYYNATVSGGVSNTAGGAGATVPGGVRNTASGDSSFAAGWQANAVHSGAFVWADNSGDNFDYFSSTGVNQFLIRASGGVGIGTNAPTAGYQLDVQGQAVFRPGGSGGGVIGFATPNSETGLTISGSGTTRADLRFDGTTIKLVAATAGIPPATNGITVSTNGNVGIGDSPFINTKLSVVGGSDMALYATSSGTGVRGDSNSSQITSAGVFGYNFGNGGIGVTGLQETSNGTGVYGVSTNATGYGVVGRNLFNGYAGYFDGKVHVNGILTKNGGSFKIDHPLDPENKYLYHSFVESPDMKNLYDGTVTTDVNGDAEVTLPDWFAALNRDFRYQLTCIGVFAQAIIAEKIKDNRFKIKTSLPNVEVSWQVTGTRQDAWANQNRLPVEELKPEIERGFYQNPTAFGQPEEKGTEWARRPEQMRQMKEQRDHPQPERNPQPAVPAARHRQN